MTEERYVIGRNGAFATLYDTVERRLLVENTTEGFCLKVRAWLTAHDNLDPTRFATPDGCRWCGDEAFHHGATQWAPVVGSHPWVRPWDWQRLDRMLNRRAARTDEAA